MDSIEAGLVELVKSFMPESTTHTFFVMSAGVKLASRGASHEALPILRAALPAVRRRLGSRHPHVQEAALALMMASAACDAERAEAKAARENGVDGNIQTLLPPSSSLDCRLFFFCIVVSML